MNPRTRHLVRLLGDPVTQAIIARLRASSCTVKQLCEDTGSSQRTIDGALELLMAYGLTTEQAPVKTGGRPAASWSLHNREALDIFVAAAETLAKDLQP